MTRSRIAIVGAGQRVVQTALPVLRTLTAEFELAGIFSRTPRTLEAAGARHEVEPLEKLDAARVRELDALYVVVAKSAVPDVIERLAGLEPRNVDLLIETPVMLPKHLHRAGALGAFRTASVTEDCLTLPFVEAIGDCVRTGAIGELRSAVLSHAAYAYHGIATFKALLGARHVVSARRRHLGGPFHLREYSFDRGLRGVAIDPRDYSAGRVMVVGSRGSIADHAHREDGHIELETLREGSRCAGFKVGDAVRRLNDAEQDLMGEPRPGDGVWVWMDGCKRVGFRQLLLGLCRSVPAYPVQNALEDALVDYHLEKFGGYVRNPLTSAGGLVVGTILRSVRPRPREWPGPVGGGR
ncbi:Gfo/Idh/MocA family oxidoreductase [Engelhardtia mirabilis]|uniref:Gfo/Idh/MocA-like oxidoreductase N-terminal domain-containing protein n=1 Tax=Engelhardtia mirabilis TaxID=2528011 RepID=A0A518BNG7_9BACT|nr:hypothetical protein Pla133_36270 [Planctomycetes bacterium Pla133]QDV02854.1 hypothetical protein Pla86_36250 [Planctomycetes bacterium Pla86]